MTVTVADAMALPPAPVAVIVYVVVEVGETLRLPDATGVTLPIPWFRLRDVAFVEVQLSVAF